VVVLAREDAVKPLTEAIEKRYNRVHPKPARILKTLAAAGAGLETL